ncbi:hypothetical protein [Pontibacter brevis]
MAAKSAETGKVPPPETVTPTAAQTYNEVAKNSNKIPAGTVYLLELKKYTINFVKFFCIENRVRVLKPVARVDVVLKNL